MAAYNIYPQWYHDTPAADYLADLCDWVQTDSEGRGKTFLGGVNEYRRPKLACETVKRLFRKFS